MARKYLLYISSILMIGQGLLSLVPMFAASPYLDGHNSYVVSRGSQPNHQSYYLAKQHLKTIFSDHKTTFYCHCPMVWPKVNLTQCLVGQDIAYLPKYSSTEFEHLYPMDRFKKRLARIPFYRKLINQYCQKKSRACLRKHIPIFSHFEGNMIHIRPVVKELNRKRGTKWFYFEKVSQQQLSQKRFHCQISFSHKYFYTPHRIKGNIARIMLSLHQSYSTFNLFTQDELEVLTNWHHVDPMDADEAKISAKILGYQNHPYVAELLSRYHLAQEQKNSLGKANQP
ncbi:MAG: endonuclease [Proteobacteria bacterium]|nr:endonuclease [Pseudomonadota bacterium]